MPRAAQAQAKTSSGWDETPIPTNLPEGQRRRIYERRLEAAMLASQDAANAPYKALLMQDSRFSELVAERLWMQIEPILNAGGEGLMRNIKRNMRGTIVA